MNFNSVYKERSGECKYFPALKGNIETDVLIIGGGITGLLNAYLLNEAGISTVLVEAMHIGDGTTGMSSCHLTTDIDTEYRNVYADFGEEISALVAQSRVEGINLLERIVNKHSIQCDFKRVPGYLYTDIPEHVPMIEQEFRYAGYAGLNINIVNQVPLPIKTNKAIVFNNQAQFNSQKFLNGLASLLDGTNCKIFENSRIISLEEHEGYYTGNTEAGSVKAKKVIMATHLPLFTNVLQTMAAPYISYVITVRLNDDNYPDGLFWDTNDPYHYIRTYRDELGPLLVVGGADHKAGHITETEEQFVKLENYVRKHFNVSAIVHKWSAEYFEPADGLPYIGRSPFSENIYVATGFSGDGLVYGPIAAIILSDLIQGKKNDWLKAYDSTRFTPVASAFDFIKENVDVAKQFIADRLTGDEGSIETLAPGEGKIIRVNGERMAVAKDHNHEIHAVSPVCTHMKCIVHYNKAEQSWDCPCHGSRFAIDGKVLYGPAVKALEKKEIKMEVNNRKD
ncbi:MAG: FAD-dependent oxidoreductase [Cytophagaceae bacterium]